MIFQRRAFLGKLSAALGLLFVGGPQKLYAALRRPTITEMLTDDEWHQLDFWWQPGRYEETFEIAVDGVRVRWPDEDVEWPPGQTLSCCESRPMPGDDPCDLDLPHRFQVRRWKAI